MIDCPAMVSNPPRIAAPIGTYSHLAVVPAGSELLVLAGQIGMKPDGTLRNGVDAQYEQALLNIAAILRSRGAGGECLVKVTIYLTQQLNPKRAAESRRRALGDILPTATLVYVQRLARPELLVEVEAMAAVRSSSR